MSSEHKDKVCGHYGKLSSLSSITSDARCVTLHKYTNGRLLNKHARRRSFHKYFLNKVCSILERNLCEELDLI